MNCKIVFKPASILLSNRCYLVKQKKIRKSRKIIRRCMCFLAVVNLSLISRV